MPDFPDDKNLWLYRVYSGVTKSKSVETKTTTGMSLRGKVGNDKDSSQLIQMLAEEMDELPELTDIHDTSNRGRGRGRSRRGKGRGKGALALLDVTAAAPKRVSRRAKPAQKDDDTPEHMKKARPTTRNTDISKN